MVVMRVAEADYLGFYTSLTAKSDRKVCNLIGRFSLHYHANYPVVCNFTLTITKFGVH